MEKSVDQMRKQNEKLARAIRRVKDDPNLVEEVKQMTEQGLDSLESQVQNPELEKLRESILEEKMKKEEQDF